MEVITGLEKVAGGGAGAGAEENEGAGRAGPEEKVGAGREGAEEKEGAGREGAGREGNTLRKGLNLFTIDTKLLNPRLEDFLIRFFMKLVTVHTKNDAILAYHWLIIIYTGRPLVF